MKPFLAVLTLFSILMACAPAQETTVQETTVQETTAQETTAQEVSFTSADKIDEVVEQQMLEIDKATVELDGESFAPEELAPDMENNLLFIIFAGGSRALSLPIDVTSKDIRAKGTIVLLEIGEEGAKPLYVLEDYDLSEDGRSYVVTGQAQAPEGDGTAKMRVVYSDALLGAGTSEFRVEGSEAHLSGDLGTRTYAQLKNLIAEHPEVDTLVLGEISGSVNDDVNMHTGRLVRSSGLTTKVLADSQIASGGVDLFASGAKRIYTEGATVGVHSWCCLEGKTAAELPKDHPAHAGQLEYFREMLGEELGPEFYFYTLESAPFDGIYSMTAEDVERFTLATEGF